MEADDGLNKIETSYIIFLSLKYYTHFLCIYSYSIETFAPPEYFVTRVLHAKRFKLLIFSFLKLKEIP